MLDCVGTPSSILQLPVSCKNGDPPNWGPRVPFSWENGDPGPYFHIILWTPGFTDIGDPLMKMGTPNVHWLERSVCLWLVFCYTTIAFYPYKLLGYSYMYKTLYACPLNISYPRPICIIVGSLWTMGVANVLQTGAETEEISVKLTKERYSSRWCGKSSHTRCKALTTFTKRSPKRWSQALIRVLSTCCF